MGSPSDECYRLYTFEIPRKQDGSPGRLGLPIGRHVQIAVHFKDQAVLRSYTPVRPVLASEDDGTFDLLVKTYLPSADSPFPPGGTVSNYLDCMEEGESQILNSVLRGSDTTSSTFVGEEIDIRGPTGGITYTGHGNFDIEGNEYHFDKVELLCGRPYSTSFTRSWIDQPRRWRERPHSALAAHSCYSVRRDRQDCYIPD